MTLCTPCSAFVEPGVIVMILIANGKSPVMIVILRHLLNVLMRQQQTDQARQLRRVVTATKINKMCH